MKEEAKERIQRATAAIQAAVALLKMERPTIDEFLEECRKMDSFGHIIDPTLFNKPERRAVSAVLEPLFQAAVEFVSIYEAQVSAAASALAKVNGS